MTTEEKASLDRYLNNRTIARFEAQSVCNHTGHWSKDQVLGQSIIYPGRLVFSYRYDGSDEKYSNNLYQTIAKNCQRDPLIKESFARTSSQEKAIGQNNEFPGPIKIEQLLRKGKPKRETNEKSTERERPANTGDTRLLQ